MPAVITLTTDFGLEDPFVGIMKGVILNVCPAARLIDITHQIEPQNILQAAWVLKAAHTYFPKNSVHLVVVDPGVGSERRPIAVKTRSAFFVAPDNGVLTPVLDKSAAIYELTKQKYFLKDISSTFHGRDVFAPAAAWIAKGTALSKMGSKITDPQTLTLPQPELKKNGITGEIIYSDRFGNLTTNIPADLVHSFSQRVDNMTIQVGKTRIKGLVSSYSQGKPGELGCLINSWGNLEIFCRESNAAKKLKVAAGKKIIVKF